MILGIRDSIICLSDGLVSPSHAKGTKSPSTLSYISTVLWEYLRIFLTYERYLDTISIVLRYFGHKNGPFPGQTSIIQVISHKNRQIYGQICIQHIFLGRQTCDNHYFTGNIPISAARSRIYASAASNVFSISPSRMAFLTFSLS